MNAAAQRGLDARIKVVCTMVWVICVASLPRGSNGSYGVYAGLLAVLLLSRPHAIEPTLRRVAAVLPLIVLLAALLPVFVPGPSAWQVGGLHVSRPGLIVALHVGCVAALCVASVALLSATTRSAELLDALRALRVPVIIVDTLGFMVRYLDVVRPEMQRLREARAARTISARGNGGLRTAAGVLGAGFSRAWDRAGRVADAMAARGYAGERRMLAQRKLGLRDVVIGLVLAAVTIGVRWAMGA